MKRSIANYLFLLRKEGNPVCIRKALFLSLSMLFISLTLFSQVNDRIVQGKVVDENNQPLSGVSIKIKNTNIGTMTNDVGEYNINIRSGNRNSFLIFSFTGMTTQEISVGEKNTIDVIMEPEVLSLDEVVAIGYGTMKKKDLTGAISSVKGELLANRDQPQLSQALQGTVPGLMITKNNGAPGSSATIRIRGITTIGDSDPLILVDGVPVSSIDAINPMDVDNISVLKDAASASIYGARAASGVILITTKRAKNNQQELLFNYSRGIERPTFLPKYADAVGYMKMVNELRWNDVNNTPGNEYPVFAKEYIDDYSTLNADNPDMHPNTDWMNVLLRDHTNMESAQIGFTGGSQTVQTKLSAGFDRNDGLYIGKNYKRYTLRVNNNVTISKKLKAFVDVNVLRTELDDPSESPMTNAYRAAPIYAAVWQNGLVAAGKDGNNMYAQLLLGGNTKALVNRLFGRVGLDFMPLNGLKFTGIIAPEFSFSKTKALRKKVQYTNFDDPNTYVGTTDWGLTNSLNESRIESFGITSQFFANYNTNINLDHDLGLMVGFEGNYWTTESLSAGSSDMTLNAFPYLNLSNRNNLTVGGNAYENAYHSYFGRISYDFKNKYLLQANIRFDGSSRFYKSNRWGTFPSVSLGWVLSEEEFMKSQNVFQFIKIRASYGALGNERIGNYPYQSVISFTNPILYQGTTVVAAQGAAQIAYAIQDISWEKTTSYNIGLDLSLLDRRLTATADVYKKNTTGMLLELEIPDFIGMDNPDQNAGKMHTKGWEFQIDWKDRVGGNFTYGISANLSDFKSVLDDLKGIQFLGNQVKITGSEFNEWYGYKTTGIYQTQEEVDNAVKLFPGVKPGDIGYQDINGPDGKPDGIISEYDKTLLGGSLPRYLFGGNVFLGYKNFDLNIYFQGIGKQKSQLTTNMVQPYQGSWGNVPLEIVGNSWSTYNEEAKNLGAKYPRYTNLMASNNYAMSDFWLIDGSYLRLKNVVIGYKLPESISQKIGTKSCRVYASASDFLTIDKYPNGWDPEVANTGYPISERFVFGISLKF